MASHGYSHTSPQAGSSRQRQPHDPQQHAYDVRRHAHDTQAATDHQWQPYNNQRSPHDAQTASSYQGQFHVNQLSPHDTVSPTQNHAFLSGTPVSIPQERPFGVNLTGQVRILFQQGQKYQWSIGNGGFSDVFMGEYRQMTPSGMVDARPTLVAVKIFRVSMNGGLKPLQPEDVNRRLVRESNVWLDLIHPNIQPYLGYCLDLGQTVALISPYCGNSTIKRYIANNPQLTKFPLAEDVAKGLQYLHSQNVIHGDLQCTNVLVNEAGHAVLTDFGRAKVIGQEVYSTPMMAGTAKYMAPELLPLSGEVNIDELFSKKSDVYAFGMLCFEIFTNQEPFACYNVRQDWQVVPLIHQGKRPMCTSYVQCQIPQAMWMILEACWMTAPESRPSAEQIVQRMR